MPLAGQQTTMAYRPGQALQERRVVARVHRIQHLLAQHEAADDVPNGSLLMHIDDASVAKPLRVNTQEISILGEDDPLCSRGPS